MMDVGSTEAESQGDLAMPTQGSRDQQVDSETLDQLDGFDNSIEKNITVKRKYIQSLREQLQNLKMENMKLNGNNMMYSQQDDRF